VVAIGGFSAYTGEDHHNSNPIGRSGLILALAGTHPAVFIHLNSVTSTGILAANTVSLMKATNSSY
jgi:hypothetical protein